MLNRIGQLFADAGFVPSGDSFVARATYAVPKIGDVIAIPLAADFPSPIDVDRPMSEHFSIQQCWRLTGLVEASDRDGEEHRGVVQDI